MQKETEVRIAKAVELGKASIKEIARAWDVTDRTVLRIAKRHGVRHGGRLEDQNLKTDAARASELNGGAPLRGRAVG